jgi:murein DD-endopeptidase MepM/ murein hydrolase activator NlpD
MRNSWIAPVLWLATAGLAVAQELPHASFVPGGIAVVPLVAGPDIPRAYFGDERVMVVRHEKGWHAVVGLPLTLVPGEHALTVTNPGAAEPRNTFTVIPKNYAAQRLTLQDKRQVDPGPEELKRIEQNLAAIQRAFATWSENPSPPLRFILPARGRLSSEFGLRRFFNNQARQPHNGIDIAAPEGTVVVAPAPGTVVDTGDYFFNGRTIFLDHGQGLISMYNHLKIISVQAGTRVTRGQKIGEIGLSGRVTGAHLHWSVSLNNTRVDPLLLVAGETLPPRPAAGMAENRSAGRGE